MWTVTVMSTVTECRGTRLQLKRRWRAADHVTRWQTVDLRDDIYACAAGSRRVCAGSLKVAPTEDVAVESQTVCCQRLQWQMIHPLNRRPQYATHSVCLSVRPPICPVCSGNSRTERRRKLKYDGNIPCGRTDSAVFRAICQKLGSWDLIKLTQEIQRSLRFSDLYEILNTNWAVNVCV